MSGQVLEIRLCSVCSKPSPRLKNGLCEECETLGAVAPAMRKRVYISGPVTRGNRNHHYFQGCEAEAELMRRGFAPLNPMYTIVLPFAWDGEFDHEVWMQRDLPWVAASDAVLRLPGESVGSEREVQFAILNGVPVFNSIDELEEHFK